MIQLVRHQFSRKRGDTLGISSVGYGGGDGSVERELLEIIREAQLDEICGAKKISAYDQYLNDVKKRYNSLMGNVDHKSGKLPACESAPSSFRDAQVLLSAIENNEEERGCDVRAQSVVNSRHPNKQSSRPIFDKAVFLKGVNKGKKKSCRVHDAKAG